MYEQDPENPREWDFTFVTDPRTSFRTSEFRVQEIAGKAHTRRAAHWDGLHFLVSGNVSAVS